MSNPLDRRLLALERAPDARGVAVRVYCTQAEAEADSEPPRPGTVVLGIVTGVPRCPADGAP
jgi:hypothetical protein